MGVLVTSSFSIDNNFILCYQLSLSVFLLIEPVEESKDLPYMSLIFLFHALGLLYLVLLFMLSLGFCLSTIVLVLIRYSGKVVNSVFEF